MTATLYWRRVDADVVIIGAGAAGMMCAIEAGMRGRRVILLDHARNAGEKIRISGGGRCNFTNLDIQPERFLSRNPHFALSALRRFTQWDFIAMVEQAGIAWHEKTLGQLFCDGSARQIIDMMLNAMARHSVDLRLETAVMRIERMESGFRVTTARGTIAATSLVIATGGKSIPKMGATSFGYGIAGQFGVAVTDTRPALVPLTFGPPDLNELATLSGISVKARVGCGDAVFEEGLLFTHRGLSGPSILQISSYWREGAALRVNILTETEVAEHLKTLRQTTGRISLKNALARILPEKLALLIVTRSGLDGRLGDQSNAKLDALARQVHDWQVTPTGSEGYRTAEVTLGGVDTDALNATTLEARDVPGLYFIGEVVDVTGWLGGYNFQWAWSSGWAAGQVA